MDDIIRVKEVDATEDLPGDEATLCVAHVPEPVRRHVLEPGDVPEEGVEIPLAQLADHIDVQLCWTDGSMEHIVKLRHVRVRFLKEIC